MNDGNTTMKKLTVSLPDSLDERLREYVDSEFEGMKGALSLCVKQAIEDYLDEKQGK